MLKNCNDELVARSTFGEDGTEERGMVHAFTARVRPLALVNKYPRIANMLALDWNRSPACRGYFVDLLANGRGHRQGFPANVDRDLRRLCDYYHTLHPTL
jgi:hypothetical protein